MLWLHFMRRLVDLAVGYTGIFNIVVLEMDA